jgi:hypothetical protein
LLNTQYFRNQVQRDLKDNLQLALGELAKVEVLRDHDRLAEVEAKGLEKALDGWNSLNDRKTHFVFIDYINGEYLVQARQYDGLTGLASPVVRKKRIDDRQLVARTAALMIDEDFGLVGTIPENSQGEQVEMILKGGGLGVPLDHCVAKGEVFALALIGRSVGGVQRSARQPWTLVQAEGATKNGILPCRILHRYDPPLPRGPGIIGYRCLKLGTTKAPLRLRVVADKIGTPLNALQVSISRQAGSATDTEGQATNTDGLIKTVKEYDHVAFIRIKNKGELLTPTIPVEILGDRIVACDVKLQPKDEQRGQLFARRDRWIGRINESLAIAYTLGKELNETVDQSRDAAKEKARSGLELLGETIGNLQTELSGLRKEEQATGVALQLDEGEQRLKDLEAVRLKIQGFLTKLGEIIKDEQDPKRQRWEAQVLKAKSLEFEAEYDRALDLYDKVLQEAGDDKLKRYVQNLKEEWKPKSDQHKEARKFIYSTWPKLRSAIALKDKLAEVRKAFETCRDAGDRLTPRKLKLTNVLHAENLAQEVNSIRPGEREDDAQIAKAIIEVSEQLTKLNKEVEDFLGPAK